MNWLALVESNTTGTGRDFAEAARRRGLRPVLLTRSPDRYPYATELGMDVRLVDTTSTSSIAAAACREPGLTGVTSSSEYFVSTAADVAGRLGLRAPDPRAIDRCRDKAIQRQWLAERGIPVPEFTVCRDPAEVAEWTRGRSVVVKPVSGSGSVGVRGCAGSAEAAGWARQLLVDADRVLVEQEILGPEYSVELLDGVVVGITRKHLGAPPHFVEIGHDFPASPTVPVARRLAGVARAAVRAIGLTIGPAHVELRVWADRPYLIEINPRLAGGLIPRLIRYATGRDLVDEVVAGAAGLPPAPTSGRAGFAAIRFLVPRPGLVRAVTGLARARGLPGVVEAECSVAAGTPIRIEHSFTDRRGHVIGVGDSAQGAAAIAEQALAAIEIDYTPVERGDRHVRHRTAQRHLHPADPGDARSHAAGATGG